VDIKNPQEGYQYYSSWRKINKIKIWLSFEKKNSEMKVFFYNSKTADRTHTGFSIKNGSK
jgi:hypothetical protein